MQVYVFIRHRNKKRKERTSNNDKNTKKKENCLSYAKYNKQVKYHIEGKKKIFGYTTLHCIVDINVILIQINNSFFFFCLFLVTIIRL
jgi:hypothetical protein